MTMVAILCLRNWSRNCGEVGRNEVKSLNGWNWLGGVLKRNGVQRTRAVGVFPTGPRDR